MAEYISRDKVLSYVYATHSTGGFKTEEDYLWLQEAVVDAAAADVQPMKRGKWEEHHATYIKQLDAWFVQAKCSYCGRYSDKVDNYSQYLDLEYCSHCGADMRGDSYV